MTPKFCPHCGAPLRPGQIYCIECGTHLDTWSSDDGEKSVPGEVTSIMNRINLAVDEGIASPDPIPEPAVAPLRATQSTVPVSGADDDAKPGADGQGAECAEGEQGDGAEQGAPEAGEAGATPTIVSPLSVNYHHEERFKGEGEWESGNRRYLIIIGAVVLVALVLVFVIIGSCSRTNTDPQAQNVVDIVTNASQNKDNQGSNSNSNGNSNGNSNASGTNSGSSSSKDEGETEQEKADHEKVKANREKLDAEAEKVNAAVETYRNTHTKTRAEREKAAQEAKDLAAEVTSAQDSAKTSGIANSSKYGTANQSIVSCYDNLSAVMAEVNKFWNWDLGFNYPEYYPEQLTTPFEESCAASGAIGSALSKYETTYRSISI